VGDPSGRGIHEQRPARSEAERDRQRLGHRVGRVGEAGQRAHPGLERDLAERLRPHAQELDDLLRGGRRGLLRRAPKARAAYRARPSATTSRDGGRTSVAWDAESIRPPQQFRSAESTARAELSGARINRSRALDAPLVPPTWRSCSSRSPVGVLIGCALVVSWWPASARR
jgi:hypothetical protein